jgi:sortase A
MVIKLCLTGPRPFRLKILRIAQYLFLLAGCGALGYSVFTYFQAGLYQVLETRRFEARLGPNPNHAAQTSSEIQNTFLNLIPGPDDSSVSRIEIPRIGISAMVVEGVGSNDLSLAVGHIPGTALPGAPGNVGIAGHRDTFFRNLGSIQRDDVITLKTYKGSYQYTVDTIEIVEPDNVQVLSTSRTPILTLVTCYPFHYLGPAPRRFIVKARLVEDAAFEVNSRSIAAF